VTAFTAFRPPVFVVAMLATALLAAAPLAAQTAAPPGPPPLEAFGQLRLPFAQAEGLDVMLETDLGVIAPELQAIPRDDQALRESGVVMVEEAGPLVQAAGWGHAAPYLYSAVIDALGRLYNSFTIDQMRLSDGTELLPRGRLTRGTLLIRVIGNRDRYKELTRDVSHAGSDGYWNPKNNEVGIFIKASQLDFARGLENPDAPAVRLRTVETLRAFLSRRFIYKVGHELFHAIQPNDNDTYLFPLIAEGTAVLAQDTVLTRETGVVMNRARPAARSPEEAASEVQCSADGYRPFNFYLPLRLKRAYDAVARDPAFSITALLAMNAKAFGDASGEDTLDRYAISYAFVYLLGSFSRNELASYKAVFDELIAKERIRSSRNDADIVDRLFRERLAAYGKRFWANPQAGAKFTAAAQRVTACLKANNSLNALGSAAEAYAYNPASAIGPLYAGDVFNKIEQPLLALEFYLLARQAFSRSRTGDTRTRIETKIADAQERTGDIEGAMTTYAGIVDTPPEDLPLLMLWCKAGSKLEYYQRIQARGIAVRSRHVARANRMLDPFLPAVEADPRYAAAIASNNVRDFQVVVQEKGRAIHESMMRDAETVDP
jgi:hypothetical protein